MKQNRKDTQKCGKILVLVELCRSKWLHIL